MLPQLNLYAVAELTAEDFTRFVVDDVGGVMVHEDQGRLSDGRRHVWILGGSDDLPSTLLDDGEALTAVLGATPRSLVIAVMSRDPSAHGMGLEVAAAFARRWPAMLMEDEVADDAWFVPSARRPGGFDRVHPA